MIQRKTGDIQVLPTCISCFPTWVPATWMQPGTNQHKSKISARETSDNPCSPPDLLVKTLNDVVCANACPVRKRKIRVGKGFFNAVLNLFWPLPFFERFGYRFRFFQSGSFAFLHMDGFEHFLPVSPWNGVQPGKHCGKNAPRTVDIWLPGILLPLQREQSPDRAIPRP